MRRVCVLPLRKHPVQVCPWCAILAILARSYCYNGHIHNVVPIFARATHHRVAFLRLCDWGVHRSACQSLCVAIHRNPWTLGREMAQVRLFSHPNVRNFLRFRGCMVFVACKSLILLNSAFFDAHILGLLFHIFVLYFHLLAFFSTSHF